VAAGYRSIWSNCFMFEMGGCIIVKLWHKYHDNYYNLYNGTEPPAALVGGKIVVVNSYFKMYNLLQTQNVYAVVKLKTWCLKLKCIL